MSGEIRAYVCGNCPLVLELGGYTALNADGTIQSHVLQGACASCGTLHRLDERYDALASLAGPLRKSGTVTVRDVSGEEFDTRRWVMESDWQPAGRHAGGVDSPFSCTCCGRVGRMLLLKDLLCPQGVPVKDLRRVNCPVCQSTMDCVGLTDMI